MDIPILYLEYVDGAMLKKGKGWVEIEHGLSDYDIITGKPTPVDRKDFFLDLSSKVICFNPEIPETLTYENRHEHCSLVFEVQFKGKLHTFEGINKGLYASDSQEIKPMYITDNLNTRVALNVFLDQGTGMWSPEVILYPITTGVEKIDSDSFIWQVAPGKIYTLKRVDDEPAFIESFDP